MLRTARARRVWEPLDVERGDFGNPNCSRARHLEDTGRETARRAATHTQAEAGGKQPSEASLKLFLGG